MEVTRHPRSIRGDNQWDHKVKIGSGVDKYGFHQKPNIITTTTDAPRLRLKDRRYISSEQPTRTSEGPTPQQRNPSRNKEHVRIRSGRRHGGVAKQTKQSHCFGKNK